MHYITDYQLDINKGFMCKVNGKTFNCSFAWSCFKKRYYVSYLLKVADAMEVPRQEFLGIFNSDHANDAVYCNSEQECYDLCQHIVKTYFRPEEIARDIISFRCGNESYKFELTVLAGKFMWRNSSDDSIPLINKNHVDVQKVKEKLSIKMYALAHCDSFGFDSREDALKFAKWVKENFYDKKEVCEKSRRHLAKYYLNNAIVKFNKYSFKLQPAPKGGWFWHCVDIGGISKDLWLQFTLNPDEVLTICNFLHISASFHGSILIFKTPVDAIKFTDHLIETFIIKKEKTYDTNQLRKERTAISRGAKPAGSIIHGRRSKASVRCGRIEHKACFGN